ncbi:MAG: hypothetical protein PHR45_07825 [Muribaculaceae bacterium]|nr:hypothetical protein [Muribaculaceae bacterium]
MHTDYSKVFKSQSLLKGDESFLLTVSGKIRVEHQPAINKNMCIKNHSVSDVGGESKKIQILPSYSMQKKHLLL